MRRPDYSLLEWTLEQNAPQAGVVHRDIKPQNIERAPELATTPDPDVAITFFSPERFASKPQVGLALRQEWRSFIRWLTWPSYGEKKQYGAWCPTALQGGVVKDGTGPVSMLVADVDDCSEGAIQRSVEALSNYQGTIIPTFNAKPEQPKHRIALRPDRPLTAEEFPIAWTKMASDLAAAGIVVDKGCKNLNRLYFACVARSPEAWLGARLLTGAPVAVDAMLDAARAEEEDAARERAARPPPRPVLEQHRDRYVAAAIDRERENVRGVGEGGRHDALLRACFALARFDDLGEDAIRDALLETFVAAAGEDRRNEGIRAIRNAVNARKRSA